MRPLITLLLAASSLTLCAAPPAGLSRGFLHFYNLEYEGAIAEFTKEIARAPNDPNAYNHLAQAILYREMYNAGALESELVTGSNPFLTRAKILPAAAEQQRFDDTVKKAIALAEARLQASPNDPESMYSLGVAHGLRANYDFLIRKLWRDSLKEFTLSRKLHNRVTELQPSMIDARLVQGVHDYIVGSLPWHWRFLGFLAGFHGDKEGGLKTVELVAREGKRNKVDAMIILAVAYRREKHAEKAVTLLDQLIGYFPQNYLYRLELVEMYGDLGKKDEALEVLKTMDAMKARREPGYVDLPAAKIQFSRGNLLFWYRDYAAAIENLKKSAAASIDAGVNTVMNSWLRLGQSYDVLGRRQEARAAYEKAVQGAPDSDAAREARRYLSSHYRRSD